MLLWLLFFWWRNGAEIKKASKLVSGQILGSCLGRSTSKPKCWPVYGLAFHEPCGLAEPTSTWPWLEHIMFFLHQNPRKWSDQTQGIWLSKRRGIGEAEGNINLESRKLNSQNWTFKYKRSKSLAWAPKHTVGRKQKETKRNLTSLQCDIWAGLCLCLFSLSQERCASDYQMRVIHKPQSWR